MNEDAQPKESVDPDNLPLTGKEAWRPGGEYFTHIIAKHKAKLAARRQEQQKKSDATE